MADKTYIFRIEIENGEAVIKGLDDIGAKGDAAAKKVRKAFESEATAGARAFTAASKETSQAVDQLASRLGPLGNILKAFGPGGLIMAGALGGLVALGAGLRGTLKDMDNLSDASQRLKVSAETLQSLRLGSREAGFDPAQADQSIQSLRDARLTALKGLRGSERAQQAFDALGIDNDDLEKLDTMEKLLTRVSQGLKLIGEEGKRAGIADALGLSPLYDTMIKLTGAIEDTNKANLELGRIVSNDVVKAGGEANDKFEEMWTKLKTSVTPAFVELGELVLPVLTKLSEWTAAIVHQVNALGQAVPNAVRAAAEAARGITPILAAVAAAGVSVEAGAIAAQNGKITESTLTEKDRVNLRRQKPRNWEEITVVGTRGGSGGQAAGSKAEADAARDLAAVTRTVLEVKGKEAQINAKLADTLDDLARARKASVITSDDELQSLQSKARAEAQRDIEEASRSTNKWLIDAAQKGADLADTIKGIDGAQEGVNARFQALDEILSGNVTSANDLLNVFVNIIAQLARMSAMGAAKGEGSFFDLFGSALGGLVSGNSSTSTPAGLPSWLGGKRALGGPVVPGKITWVGEHGPEPVMFNQPGYVVDNMSAMRALQGGGGRSSAVVNLRVVNTGPAMQVETRQTDNADGSTDIEALLRPAAQTSTKDGIAKGRFDAPLRARTGIRPQIIRR